MKLYLLSRKSGRNYSDIYRAVVAAENAGQARANLHDFLVDSKQDNPPVWLNAQATTCEYIGKASAGRTAGVVMTGD